MGKVQVYRNLHKDSWSIRSKKTGRVLLYSRGVILKHCDFIVQEGGRRKVVQSGQKGVHAWVQGSHPVLITEEEVDDLRDSNGALPYRACFYNPFYGPTFYHKDDKSPIFKARKVLLWDRMVYIAEEEIGLADEKTGGYYSSLEAPEAVI